MEELGQLAMLIIACAMMVYRQPNRTMLETNEPTSEPGTNAGSHLKQERDALESKTGDARKEAKQKAHQAYDELRQGTRKIAHESGSYLKNVATEQQHLLVEKMEVYQHALKAASDQLESEDNTAAAKNIRKVTSSFDTVVAYLRESEPNDVLSDASRMARKHPELVFGGLFVAGLGIARVMKSSARKRRHDEYASNNGPSSEADGNDDFAGLECGRMNFNSSTI